MNTIAATAASRLPNAASTRVVILGASQYPQQPALDNPRFLASALAVRDYFTSPAGYGLAAEQLLWLFDDAGHPPAQSERIAAFLSNAAAASGVVGALGAAALDIVVYYIGHGFLGPDDKAYYLALKSLKPDDAQFSMGFRALQRTLRNVARQSRRYFIVDACFSGAAAKEMMSVDAVTQRLVADTDAEAREDIAGAGTALLCAAASSEVARAPSAELHTMFTGALLGVLQQAAARDERMSLQQLRGQAEDWIRQRFKADAVRPEAHAPDQRRGNLSELPLLAPWRTGAAAAAASAMIGDAGGGGGFDTTVFDDAGAIHALVIEAAAVESDSESAQAGALANHLQLAWDYHSPQIVAAANRLRATRRQPALSTDAEHGGFSLHRLGLEQAFASQAALAAAIKALCRADVAVFDLTGFDPGVAFLLGVRAVARRGVTLASVGGDYVVGGELLVPFNLQSLNLSAHSAAQTKEGQGQQPWDLLGAKLRHGLRELAELPHYLDLPAFDAVRQIGVVSSAYKPVRYTERTLVLCPFSAAYSQKQWRQHLSVQLPARLKQHALKTGADTDVHPRLARLLDVATPRLVSQTLFEAIRLTDLCIVDWTELRANVMFEAGVRLATNPLGAVHIIDAADAHAHVDTHANADADADAHAHVGDTANVAPHVRQMLRLFKPVAYRCKAGDSSGFAEMIGRFEASLAAHRSGEVGFVFRAVGQAIDRRAQPAAPPLVDELLRGANILDSDDQQSTGLSPVLFHEVNRELADEASAAAAERRLAAWLYLTRRWTAAEIGADSQRLAQFELLASQTRRWARREQRADLLDDVATQRRAVRGLAVPLAPADFDGLIARIKVRKEEAKDAREDGDVEAAITALADAVAAVEASPLQATLLAGSGRASSSERLLAAELADLLGMLGGNQRRAGRGAAAQASFERGREIEESDRLDLNSSYSLVNAITLPLLQGERAMADQAPALQRAIGAIQRQLQGERRTDRWAWADLALCQLLLGETAAAARSHRRASELGDDESTQSMVAGLAALRAAFETSAPAEAQRFGQAITDWTAGT